jgi:hypothetical protein
LIVATAFTTLGSVIPMLLAWRASPWVRGTYTDPDFYLFIQGSILSVFGIFTAVFPSFSRPVSKARHYAYALASIGVICNLVSIALYLCATTMWSALISFLGHAIQGYMALLLAIEVHSGKPV